jgi:hypothetical protein
MTDPVRVPEKYIPGFEEHGTVVTQAQMDQIEAEAAQTQANLELKKFVSHGYALFRAAHTIGRPEKEISADQTELRFDQSARVRAPHGMARRRDQGNGCGAWSAQVTRVGLSKLTTELTKVAQLAESENPSVTSAAERKRRQRARDRELLYSRDDWQLFLRANGGLSRGTVLTPAAKRLIESARRTKPDKTKPVKPDFLVEQLRDYKGRKGISAAKATMLDAIQEVLAANRNFWPLNDRQIHYRLLACLVLRHAAKPDSVYVNHRRCYNDLTDLLTRARLAGLIPFEAIRDETRPVVTWAVHQTPQSFAKREVDNFLKGYWRDLLQSQPNHIELIGEKLTIEGTIRPVLMHYTIPYTIGRGYASLDPRHKLVERFRASGKERLILLVLSDFDPDGDEIARSFVRSLRDDFELDQEKIEPIRVALTSAQIRQFELPAVMTAKESSANYDRFIEPHADTVAHELDALTPEQLQEVLTDAIDSVIDTAAFNAELEREKEDSVWLNGVRRTVHEALRSLSLE